jgi:hypothetical protein
VIQQQAVLVVVAFLAVGCDGTKSPTSADAGPVDSGPTYTRIQAGQGPCDQGINLAVEGKPYFVPLTVLPRAMIEVDGAQQEAIALTELLPASVLEPYGFGGTFPAPQLRLLYDLRLAGDQSGAASITIAPESMASGYLLAGSRSVYLRDAPQSGRGVRVCRVDALRRLLVTRGAVTKTVHVADLPTEPYVEPGVQTVAVTFKDLITASGLLAQSEKLTQFDYRLVPVDYMDKRDSAVRFVWNHAHLVSLRWVPSLQRTRSLDTTGDLKSSSGVASYHGVASAGWASVKLLLEVVMDPAPDPAHTVTGPDGPLTDPASCAGCHKAGSGVVIPVSCSQCHPR